MLFLMSLQILLDRLVSELDFKGEGLNLSHGPSGFLLSRLVDILGMLDVYPSCFQLHLESSM